MKLSELKTPQDLATYLGVDYFQHVVFHIYIYPKEKRYLSFEIPKKSGGTRKIQAPATHLKTLQRKLASKLIEEYRVQHPAHGFLRQRSIITNADRHINKRYVLNIDLKDFFGTINFGRVRGMFMGKPYSLPPKIATILAQICCHDNALPQGAPTSPIITNMICSKLDNQLRKMAQSHLCTYTRYADDITISTNRKLFPKDIATITPIKNGEGKEVIIGSDLANIVESNGFVINAVKSRFQTREDRQEVTGLVVNKKRNINRRFIRNVRAMLYSLKKVGSEQATLKHFLKNKSHHIPTFKSRTSIEKIIRGKIEFIRSIRGNSFSTYVTLANKFNTICKGEKPLPIPTLGQFKLYSDNVYLIINSNNLQDYTRQATAFYLNDVKGFVTCQHLLRG